jgi:hypothetical protein
LALFCDSDDEVGDCRVALAHTLANLNHFSVAGSNYAAAIFSFFNMKQANIYQVLYTNNTTKQQQKKHLSSTLAFL